MTIEQARKNTDILLRSYIFNVEMETVEEVRLDVLKRIIQNIKGSKTYQIVELYYFKGKTLEETAEIMDISDSTVKRYKKKFIDDLTRVLYPVTQYE